jgi:FkbM family methyltransferase
MIKKSRLGLPRAASVGNQPSRPNLSEMSPEPTLKRDVRDVIRYIVMRASRPQELPYHGAIVPVAATPQLRSLTRKIIRGLHESFEIEAVKALLRPSDVVLEVGAGTGVLSAIMAKLGAQVHAFEPNRTLLSSAQAVFVATGVEIDYRSVAVGVEEGHARFFVDSRSQSGGSSSLINRGNSLEIDVPVVSFHDVCEELHPTFLMVDAEGAERDLLTAALPATVRVVCVEIHPHVIGSTAASKIVYDLLGQGFILNIDHSGQRVFAFTRDSSAR